MCTKDTAEHATYGVVGILVECSERRTRHVVEDASNILHRFRFSSYCECASAIIGSFCITAIYTCVFIYFPLYTYTCTNMCFAFHVTERRSFVSGGAVHGSSKRSFSSVCSCGGLWTGQFIHYTFTETCPFLHLIWSLGFATSPLARGISKRRSNSEHNSCTRPVQSASVQNGTNGFLCI